MTLEDLLVRQNELLERMVTLLEAGQPQAPEEPKVSPNTMLNQRRAAAYCGITDQRLLRYRKRGEINAVINGSTPMYRVRDLDSLIVRYGLNINL